MPSGTVTLYANVKDHQQVQMSVPLHGGALPVDADDGRGRTVAAETQQSLAAGIRSRRMEVAVDRGGIQRATANLLGEQAGFRGDCPFQGPPFGTVEIR
ncbi:hypothetical protein [Streptomyces sp. NPDC050564]|uniref:hypothetical protein n=1 Tax=Streptomyces sp. NPDC050564 TaxID=3365631 RepID=UPI0037AE4E3A